jgi:hypothetical protein
VKSEKISAVFRAVCLNAVMAILLAAALAGAQTFHSGFANANGDKPLSEDFIRAFVPAEHAMEGKNKQPWP